VVEDMMINFLILLIPKTPYLWCFHHPKSPGSNDKLLSSPGVTRISSVVTRISPGDVPG